jgi:hypothetical protein
MSCPFYGRAAHVLRQGFVYGLVYTGTGGNQCALLTQVAHAPCQMEVRGDAPDWERCPFHPDAGAKMMHDDPRTPRLAC